MQFSFLKPPKEVLTEKPFYASEPWTSCAAVMFHAEVFSSASSLKFQSETSHNSFLFYSGKKKI